MYRQIYTTENVSRQGQCQAVLSQLGAANKSRHHAAASTLHELRALPGLAPLLASSRHSPEMALRRSPADTKSQTAGTRYVYMLTWLPVGHCWGMLTRCRCVSLCHTQSHLLQLVNQ